MCCQRFGPSPQRWARPSCQGDVHWEQLGPARSLSWCLLCPFPGWSYGSSALPVEQRRAERPPAQSKELLGTEAGVGQESAHGGLGSVSGAPWGREQGGSPPPSLLQQVHKTLLLLELQKLLKRRILQLQALVRQCWWVLVVKEPASPQPAPAGDVPRGPITPWLSPGDERQQECQDPHPMGLLGWPGQDQCTFLLGDSGSPPSSLGWCCASLPSGSWQLVMS